MSIAEIKDSVKTLPASERHELVSYLVHLEQTESEDFLTRITSRVDDTEKFQPWAELRDLPEGDS